MMGDFHLVHILILSICQLFQTTIRCMFCLIVIPKYGNYSPKIIIYKKVRQTNTGNNEVTMSI